MDRDRIRRLLPEAGIPGEHYGKLNREQRSVVMHGGGPMLVLAGAGTGKTTTVTHRVARLVETGADPGSILLLTFTNKAARDMMMRAGRLIGESIGGLWGGTFHHLCNMILRMHGAESGYPESYTIMDRDDTRQMMKEILSELRSDGIVPKPAVLIAINSLAKNSGRTIEQIVQERFFPLSENIPGISQAIRSYEERKERLNLLDFDDLLVNTLELLCKNGTVADAYQERFMHILVDEYQDTNHIQAEIVDRLAELHRNLMVVGDDAQSIYSFRGADFENIIRFTDRYPEAETYRLTTNYRSTPEILELANDAISHNTRQFRKELRSVKYNSGKPCITALEDVYSQSQFVVSKTGDIQSGGERLSSIAVLYRSHYQSMELQMELQKRGVPFEVRSGLRFFEMAHIKDILSYLRIVLNPFDEMGWKRVLRLIPGVGAVTANRLFGAVCSKNNPLDEMFNVTSLGPKKSLDGLLLLLNALKSIVRDDGMIDPSSAIETVMLNGYEKHLYTTYPNAASRVEDIGQMRQYASGYETIEEFVSDMSLQASPAELMPDNAYGDDLLILTTVHQAKGLEWNTVFIIGLNDGRFPSVISLKEGAEEEERRLFYVAATRAKERLFLCYTLTGGYSDGAGFLKPSRFIRELDRQHYDRMSIERDY